MAAVAGAGLPIQSAQAQEKADVSGHKPLSKQGIFGTMEVFRLPAYNPIFDFAGPKIVDLLKIPGMRRSKKFLDAGIISTPKKIRQLTPMAGKYKLISLEKGGLKVQLEELLQAI